MLTRETAILDSFVKVIEEELSPIEAAQFGERLKQVGTIAAVWHDVDRVGIAFATDLNTVWCCEFRAVRVLTDAEIEGMLMIGGVLL